MTLLSLQSTKEDLGVLRCEHLYERLIGRWGEKTLHARLTRVKSHTRGATESHVRQHRGAGGQQPRYD